MFFCRNKQPDTWHKTLEKYITRLESGDLSGLRVVYCAFASDDPQLIRRAGNILCQTLSLMPDAQLFKLCERFRTFTSLEWNVDWKNVSLLRTERELSEHAYRYVLILGSFHPNGYFREKCMRAMARQSGMLFWLLPRANDWVPQIRTEAFRLLKIRLASCDGPELIASLPAVERLRGCRRRMEKQMQELEAQVQERLSLLLKTMDIQEIFPVEPKQRAALYRMTAQYELWSLSEMESCLQREKMSCLKRILIRKILSHPDCTLSWAEHYLTDSSSQVRRMAVEFRYEHLNTCWPGLETMLLDRSKGIREYAAYILEQHSSLDIRRYYLEHLQDDAPEYAILGLSEFSSCGNVQKLLEGLKNPDRRVLKCTLLALGNQEDFSEEELLWKYLLDNRNDISKAAYQSIRKRNFHPGAERIYKACRRAEQAHQKRYLVHLLLRESSWERLPYLLLLYREKLPEHERKLLLSGIRSRSMYGKVTEPLQKQILLALEQSREELPDGIREEILYDMKFLIK